MSTQTILIIGTGYTGMELARLAIAAGFDVVGTTRTPEKLDALRALGATPILWSADDDLAPLRPHLSSNSSVVYSIPTLFKSYEAPTGSPPRHVAPIRRLIDACEGIDRFIYLSSISVYGDHQGQWVDETAPLRPNATFGKMRADIEAYLMSCQVDFPIAVARLGGIYGPGRTLAKRMRQGRYTLIAGDNKLTNRIHVHDIARALLAILTKGPHHHRVYNFTDGHPQPARDVVAFICANTELPWPPEETLADYTARTDDPNRIARRSNTIRVLNARLRQELGFEFIYPDVFAGYRALLKQGEASTDPTAEAPS